MHGRLVVARGLLKHSPHWSRSSCIAYTMNGRDDRLALLLTQLPYTDPCFLRGFQRHCQCTSFRLWRYHQQQGWLRHYYRRDNHRDRIAQQHWCRRRCYVGRRVQQCWPCAAAFGRKCTWRLGCGRLGSAVMKLHPPHVFRLCPPSPSERRWSMITPYR